MSVPAPTPDPRWTPEDYRKRPRDYDPRLCEEILERIENGEFLQQICKELKMPLPGTFLRWVDEEADLEERYIAARRRGTDVLLDESQMQAQFSDPVAANTRFRATSWYVERSHPEKYGPSSTLKLRDPKDKNGAGIDYAAQLRRRIDAMASRASAEDAARDEASSPDS